MFALTPIPRASLYTQADKLASRNGTNAKRFFVKTRERLKHIKIPLVFRRIIHRIMCSAEADYMRAPCLLGCSVGSIAGVGQSER